MIDDNMLSALLNTPEAREALYLAAEEDAERVARQYDVYAIVCQCATSGASYAVVMAAAYIRLHRRFRIAQYAVLASAACIAAMAVACLWVIGGRG